MKNYRFPLIFIAIYMLLQFAYLSAPDWFVKDFLVSQITVIPGASFINFLFNDVSVHAEGTRIVSGQGSINVLRGCEGTETMLMLIAAVLASGRKFIALGFGLCLGCLLIFVLNQLRIAGLFWVVVYQRDLFDVIHGYIAPLFIVASAAGFYLLWLKNSQTTALAQES